MQLKCMILLNHLQHILNPTEIPYSRSICVSFLLLLFFF